MSPTAEDYMDAERVLRTKTDPEEARAARELLGTSPDPIHQLLAREYRSEEAKEAWGDIYTQIEIDHRERKKGQFVILLLGIALFCWIAGFAISLALWFFFS